MGMFESDFAQYHKNVFGSQPEKVFKNQDEQELGPGFSKEFYNELHRFFSKGNRRSGRTYILARVLLHTAIETGSEIAITDHYSLFKSSFHVNHHIAMMIHQILDEYYNKGLDIDFRWCKKEETFKASLKGNIYEATRLYNVLKNEYVPLNNKYSIIPEEISNRKLFLII